MSRWSRGFLDKVVDASDFERLDDVVGSLIVQLGRRTRCADLSLGEHWDRFARSPPPVGAFPAMDVKPAEQALNLAADLVLGHGSRHLR